MTRVVIGWKSVLYQGTVYKAELKLSRHPPHRTMSDLFWDLFLAFFFGLIYSEFSEQASRQGATEEPNKGL